MLGRNLFSSHLLSKFVPVLRTGPRYVSSTIHIHNLPLSIKRDDLQAICSEFGSITSLFFIKSRNGKSMIATITYKHVGSAIAIVDEMDDTIFLSRSIKVIFSKKIEAPKVVKVPRISQPL